jgi:hypothetical protein
MTAQAAEILHHKGKVLQLTDEPLELYLTNSRWKPNFEAMSTACWRGYIGEWEIDNDRLYLLAVHDPTLSETADLSEIFPESRGRVFAHWVTGEYRCPMGKLLEYIHMGFASTHERDLFLNFKQGELVGERVVINGKSDDRDAPDGYGPFAWFTSRK